MLPLINKIILSLAILMYATLSSANEFDRLSTMYNEKKYEQVIEEITFLLNAGNELTLHHLLLLGKSYVDFGKAHEAIPHLRNIITQKEKIPGWMNTWSLYYLGKAYARLGEMDSASHYLQTTIATKREKKVVKAAKMDFVSLGLDPMFTEWNMKETGNFKFYFPKNTEVKDIYAFAKTRQEAFDSINTFFNAKLPKKIDFYVWNKTIDYDKKTKLKTGFAIPELAIVHTRYFQTIGHEMTHVISFFSVDNKHRSAFINEGIATRFNLSDRNTMEMAKKARTKCDVPIIQMWQRNDVFRSIDPVQSYSIAAAFIDKLLSVKGNETFMQLLANQTYENAMTLYDNQLDAIIEEFENELKS